MTHAEIRRMYRESKNKKEQIKILADLNLCTVDEIKEILNEKPRSEKEPKAAAPKIHCHPMPEIAKKVLCATLDSIEAKIKQVETQLKELEEYKKTLEKDYTDLAKFMEVKR